MNPQRGLVLDANILMRAVLGRRVRELLERYEDSATFYSPDVCFDDARIIYLRYSKSAPSTWNPVLLFSNVSAGIKRDQIHRFRRSHSDGKSGFGHTTAPVGVHVNPSHTSEPSSSNRTSTQATTLQRTQQERQC
jgi:hypothetical protein